MRGHGAPGATFACRAVLTALTAALLASCSATGDPLQRLGITPQSIAASEATAQVVAGDLPAGQHGYFIIDESDPVLPDLVNQVPQLQSGEAPVVVAAVQPAPEPAEVPQQDAFPPSPAPADMLAERMAGEPPAQPAPIQQAAQQAGQQPAQAEAPAVTQQAFAPPQPAATQQKRGFFASLFSRQPPRPAAPVGLPAPQTAEAASPEQQVAEEAAEAVEAVRQPDLPAPAPTAFVENRPVEIVAAMPQQRKLDFRSGLFTGSAAAASRPQPPIRLASTGPASENAAPRPMFGTDALPGVRQGALFEINRRDSLDDDADIDLYEDSGVQVASAAGLARLAPNGLLKQTDNVDVACLKPSLVRVLKTIEARYGKKLIVTSGYRSPPRNRAARGAKNSLHMYCAAADVQIPGVDKWELASYLRSMPGRGGVGTYCHTNSVHIDVGPERDWNWRCRRRR